uniref:Protein kinase domain-containing protein n=1 Tax=Chromera velia CCMP2878 TaxID=1169474 RepID=A0A0G4GJ99_9ALVE|eukprot:Cvel_22139.t1-p1 / transcript=Cvel_22139.t1 / gene=Cvel_22139 / organism=Chromera_velia_CCMP2878 / gene_product=Wall-associated receptor kinase-like 21, putative / transcript_product=Wall-associated receptor kinase-like 21, putative / location=Cvel_scaffold2147:12898-15732(+) / protein_length=945 / sequence_SO=supercontig / SO=protein_coding / is_pseudo=false
MPRNSQAVDAVSLKLAEGTFVEEVPLEFVERCTLNFSDERKLGSSTFGIVYKAVDAVRKQSFAVKVLNVNVLQPLLRDGSDEEAVQQLIQAETAALRALPQEHPNLCRLLGVCTGRNPDGIPYVMVLSSLGRLGDLAASLRSNETARKPTWQDRVSVARQLCNAVSFLHNLPTPIFHRDLESENIVLGPNWAPMLVDWALDRLVPETDVPSHTATTRGLAIGTRGYMCPQYTAEEVFTGESEVYSLGVVLLELFTGKIQSPIAGPDLVKQYAGEDLYSNDPDAPPTVHTLCAEDSDRRAGDWDVGVAGEFASLILDCLRKKRRRILLKAVLRAFCALERRAAAVRPGEAVLREQLARMRSVCERELVWEDVRRQREVEQTVCCSSCRETVKKDEGAECPRENPEHFLCRGCFGNFVCQKVEEGLEMREDVPLLPCPFARRGCEEGEFYDQRVVALNCSAEAYKAFRKSRDGMLRAAVRAERDEEIRREGMVGFAKRGLEEELNHFCCTPCCSRLFVYDGCAAVDCSLCNKFFCALCLPVNESDEECHRHVRGCELNPEAGNPFVSAETLLAVHRPLLAQRVREFLDRTLREQPDVHAALLQDDGICGHLRELQVEFEEGALQREGAVHVVRAPPDLRPRPAQRAAAERVGDWEGRGVAAAVAAVVRGGERAEDVQGQMEEPEALDVRPPLALNLEGRVGGVELDPDFEDRDRQRREESEELLRRDEEMARRLQQEELEGASVNHVEQRGVGGVVQTLVEAALGRAVGLAVNPAHGAAAAVAAGPAFFLGAERQAAVPDAALGVVAGQRERLVPQEQRGLAGPVQPRMGLRVDQRLLNEPVQVVEEKLRKKKEERKRVLERRTKLLEKIKNIQARQVTASLEQRRRNEDLLRRKREESRALLEESERLLEEMNRLKQVLRPYPVELTSATGNFTPGARSDGQNRYP